MFMLKDEDESPLIQLEEHAKCYINGILSELVSPCGVRRVECMTPDPAKPDAFKDGYKMLKRGRDVVNSVEEEGPAKKRSQVTTCKL